MLERATDTCEWLADVDASAMVDWILAIRFSDWHQQNGPGEPLRPAMMTDLAWHGFGKRSDGIVADLVQHFPGCAAYQRMLSVVMPDDAIAPHIDKQPETWITRVHVPLATNDASRFIVSDVAHNLRVGAAYRVNTRAVHAVENAGPTPRIHFMFDVGR